MVTKLKKENCSQTISKVLFLNIFGKMIRFDMYTAFVDRVLNNIFKNSSQIKDDDDATLSKHRNSVESRVLLFSRVFG